ncbi:hypothetical protein ACOSQ2_024929 [Xanthoceras sorbifolium]
MSLTSIQHMNNVKWSFKRHNLSLLVVLVLALSNTLRDCCFSLSFDLLIGSNRRNFSGRESEEVGFQIEFPVQFKIKVLSSRWNLSYLDAHVSK